MYQDNAVEIPADPLIGQVIDGRYQVDKQIGEGGMGIVYLATHTVLQKKLALKVLRGDNARDAEVVQRFMQEAQAATSIGHPNIIGISDFGRLPDNSVYFVMEFLDGMSLSDLIQRGGSVPFQTALHIVRQIASALEAAHNRGIVHRDLKPDNIYIIQQGPDPNFVKVLDFGIAKVGGAASKLTRTGMVFGTPHYMSPEQAAGQNVDARTDVYALGVIMYEMFTGKVPFDADTFMGILSKHMFEPPPTPIDLSGASLGPLEAVILNALQKKADDRYQSMAELVNDLDRIASGIHVEVRASTSVASPPANLAEALEPPTTALAGESSGPPRALLLALALITLVVVGGIVATTVFFLAGSGGPLAGRENVTSEVGEPPPDEGVEVGSVAVPPPGETDSVTDSTSPQAPAGESGAENESYIAIDSDPPGAEVLLAGVMVGNTPARVPRPATGTESVIVRMRGHRDTTIQLSEHTSESIHVALRPLRRRGARTRRPPRTTPRRPEVARQPPARRPPPRVGSSEVVDPWAQ